MTIIEEKSFSKATRELSSDSNNLYEQKFEESLRPQFFSDYVGQKKHLENLMVMAKAAKARDEAMDHCLLFGPPGLGKTTLATIIAKEMGRNLFVTSGPALEKKGDLAGILTALKKGDVLFIDEIHRLNPIIEENIYPAMEEFRFDIVLGEGAHARIMPLKLEPFTLVGATTKTGLLTSPLRDRFGFSARLDYYDVQELAQIVKRSAKILKVSIDDEASAEIARRSRGTPRIANRLLKRMRDFAQVLSNGYIDKELTQKALKSLGVDEHGLDTIDNRILELLCTLNSGAPLGIDTISASLSESSSTIEDVYEPYLLQQAYIIRTPRGRQATKKAYEHLGLDYSQGKHQGTLGL
ncbi:MAG: Holliday junction branch migration DNA helicase RuvB [Myxococcales bacterium]|nr:Holliday junction branch migration DNA helicase RuvB [Myxococcales bacterium]USN51028.1 MAG: Holliday junction branch migration DNA helicase RuvB [Myxococcales bacterium]